MNGFETHFQSRTQIFAVLLNSGDIDVNQAFLGLWLEPL